MALFITFLLGLFFVVGILIIRITDKTGVVEHVSISLACGAMVALLCFDLIPEVVEEHEVLPVWAIILLVAAGVGILKLVDLFVPEHGDHDSDHAEGMVHIGIMAAAAISIHNILEGMSVFSIASVNPVSGISLGIGVGLHNIPMGMLIYAMLKKEHSAVKKYTILTITVLSTFIGGLLMYVLSPLFTEEIITALICITVGMVLFIVIFELIPAILFGHKKFSAVLFFILGFILVFSGGLLEDIAF